MPAIVGAIRRNECQVSTHYILRLRQMLETVRKLQPPGESEAIEQQLAQLERELQEAATEMTIQACRQEVERREPHDRRQSTAPVPVDSALHTNAPQYRRPSVHRWRCRPAHAG